MAITLLTGQIHVISLAGKHDSSDFSDCSGAWKLTIKIVPDFFLYFKEGKFYDWLRWVPVQSIDLILLNWLSYDSFIFLWWIMHPISELDIKRIIGTPMALQSIGWFVGRSLVSSTHTNERHATTSEFGQRSHRHMLPGGWCWFSKSFYLSLCDSFDWLTNDFG